jgi:hypothetical protein
MYEASLVRDALNSKVQANGITGWENKTRIKDTKYGDMWRKWDNSIQFFIFIMLTQQLRKPITEQHETKYKTNNKNI